MAKHTATVKLLVNSHGEPPLAQKKQAMAQGIDVSLIPAPVVAQKIVEFFGEGETLKDAVNRVMVALGEFVTSEGIEVMPADPGAGPRMLQ